MEPGHPKPAALPSGTRIGPWRLVEPQGRGAYGVVYRAVAEEGEGGGSVALKLALHPWDKRFVREGELLSRLHHPAVPRLLDHGEWEPLEGVPYAWLAMEWVEGPPLYDWARVQRPTSRQVLQLLAGLARALEATHAAGGVHRDVKGDNVRVRAADGQPFLLDFGSAHYVGAATLTVQAFPPGTPAYRSPEAWRYLPRSGRPPEVPYAPGPADDVFALGVTAYRLLTGKYPPPTHPDDEDAWMWRPEERASWSPRAQNARCCLELSALVFRMLSPAPEARGSAREVAESLEEAARNAGVEADAPLFTGEEPQPAGLMPVPQHVSVPQRREASRQEPRPAGRLPVAQHGAPSSRREARRRGLRAAGLMRAPRQVTAPPRREAMRQELRPGDLMPAPQHVTAPPRREGRRPWFTAASLGAALALGAVGVLSVQAIELPEARPQAAQEEARDGGTSAVGDSALTAPVEPDRSSFVWSSIAVDVPPKPFPGQRRPNANGRCPGDVQVPINGGCWRKLPVDVKNCDSEDSVVYKGACYAPVLAPPRPSTSGPSERSPGP